MHGWAFVTRNAYVEPVRGTLDRQQHDPSLGLVLTDRALRPLFLFRVEQVRFAEPAGPGLDPSL